MELAASLVLSSMMFANVDFYMVVSVFEGVREVLKKLSYQSPEAEHNHEVLLGRLFSHR
jgi:hypothetical protein